MAKEKPVKLVASQTTPTAPPPGPREFFEFASRHFLLISALAIVLAVAAAVSGLFAYLRVFDWRLIWIVEYTDVLTWGLVALGIVSALALTGWSIIDDAIVWTASRNYWGAIGAFGLWILAFAVWLFNDYRSAEPHYGLTISAFMAILLLAVTALNIAQTAKLGPRLLMRHLIADAFFVLFTAGAIGNALGHLVRDGQGFKHHVSIRDGLDYRSVGLVMLTSRYVVVWDRDHAVILAAADVGRIEGQPVAR